MWYVFNQNNSGGKYKIDDSLSLTVFIEAENHIIANEKFKSLGGYFDGCGMGLDCSCCGDRWYACESYEGKERALYYNTPMAARYHPKDPVVYCYSKSGGRVSFFNATFSEYDLYTYVDITDMIED